MRPPCEVIVRSVLPAFRSLIARNLVENYNFSQVAAAEKLGTTQASISHYLYSKRGEKMLKKLGDSPKIQEIVNDITEGIASDNIGPIDAMLNFCKLCEALKSGNLIPDLNKESTLLNNNCKICKPLKKN